MSRVFVSLLLTAGILAGPFSETASARNSGAASSFSIFVQPGNGDTSVLSLIRSARHTIRLEVYLLDQSDIVSALAHARDRHVNVRILLEERPYGAIRYAREGYSMVQQARLNVRWANESAFTYTHEKAIVIDGVRSGIFSFNLTGSGLYSNREFGVIDRKTADASQLARIFDADWNRRSPRFSSPRLVISPYNSRPDLTHEIDRAKHTLDLYEEEMDDSSIESHLIAAKRRGVRIRLITSSDSSGVERLRSAGIGVALMSSPYVHAKAIVADRTTVFVGSENISSTSLDRNREAGILLSSRALASIVERTFGLDWNSNRPAAVSPPPASGHGFNVRVSASPRSVRKGQELTISATTTNGATCSIRVTYPDGYVSRAAALSGARTAFGGHLSWSWHVGSAATGTSRADVTCDLKNKSASSSTTFQIT